MKRFYNSLNSAQDETFSLGGGYNPLPVRTLDKLKISGYSERSLHLPYMREGWEGSYPRKGLINKKNERIFKIRTIGTHLNPPSKGRTKKAAFTLAEVLIALLIIGIVAAMTLPTLFQNIADKKNATKVAVFNSKFIAGLNSAKANGEMGTQFSSTEDFLRNGLSHNLKMIAICGPDELEKCMGYDKIRYENKSGKEKTVNVSNIKKASDINVKGDSFKDVAGFVMADGTPVMLTYDTKCDDSDNINKTISLCVAGLFDINGSSQPNMFVNKITTNGKKTDVEIGDLRSFNGASIASSCVVELDDMCFKSSAFGGSKEAYDELFNKVQEMRDEGLRNYYAFYYENYHNYWATAKDYCEYTGGQLPTTEQLAQLAQAIYQFDKPVGVHDAKDGTIIKNKDILSSLGLNGSFPRLWSSETYEDDYDGFQDHAMACDWYYFPTQTGWSCDQTQLYDDISAICVSK